MSISETEPLEVFLYAIKSNATKSRYQNRLKNFFDYMALEGDIKTQARAFVIAAQEKGKTGLRQRHEVSILSQGKSRARGGFELERAQLLQAAKAVPRNERHRAALEKDL